MQTHLLDFSLAFRNIVRQRRRSAIAIAAVVFGIAASILASGFIEWIFLGFREQTIQSRLGHLQITRPGYQQGGRADPYAFLLPEMIPKLARAGDSRRIRTVASRLSFNGLISHGESTLSFIGDGVSSREERLFQHGVQITQGANLSPDEPLSVIVGEGLARNLGVSVGDRVVLLANTVSGGTNAVELTVRGLFATVTKAYDDAALRVPIETARELLRVQGSHAWVVLLHDTADTDTVLSRLRAQLPPDRFEVLPWHELADTYNKTVTLFNKQIQGIRVIIALIILLSISNTMMMAVMERTGEIGTSMALGIKRRGLIRLFLTEGALLGVIGGLVGVVIGIALASVISAIGVPMPPPPGMAYGYTGQILVTWTIVLEAFALAVITTLLASIYPAWTASRKQIVDALRHNR